MAGAVILFELLEVDAFGAFDGNHVVVLLFIVANKEVLGVATGIRDVNAAEFVHVKNGLVLGDFVINFVVC